MGVDGWQNSVKFCPLARLDCFLHGVIDEICGRSSLHYKDYADIWDIEQWWEVTDGIKACCSEAVKEGLMKEQLVESIRVDSDYKEIIVDAIIVRNEDLRKAMIQATNHIAQASLSDFFWKVKLIMSSDKLATVNESVLSLDLDIKEGQSTKTVTVEFNKEELQSFITSLESANRVVHQLQS